MNVYGEGNNFNVSERTITRRETSDSRQLVLQKGSTLEDLMGGALLTRTYKCHRDLVATSDTLLPKQGDVDFLHRSLKYAQPYRVEYDAEIAIITVNFTGFLGRAVRVLTEPEWDTRLQETTISDLGGNISLGVVYLCPTVSVSYASDTRPSDNERHALSIGQTEQIKIKAIKGSTGFQTDIALETILRNLGVTKEQNRLGFQRKEHGGLYLCTENLELNLVQKSHIIVL